MIAAVAPPGALMPADPEQREQLSRVRERAGLPRTLMPAHPEPLQTLIGGDGAFLVRAAPLCIANSCVKWGRPPPELAACYSRQELCEAGYDISPGDAYGYSAALERSWLSVATGENTGGATDVSAESYLALIRGCIIWGSGHGEVFLRIERARDGTGIARAEARDGQIDPTILCCLREAQSSLVRALRPGTARVLMVRFNGEREFEMTSF
ncbi:hypothetical protein WME79_30155 [Sorangium sp. So ce726]|uniref:hypothetical protein n=1 Tax=Sorangium sp. So ce726 TaxID=3133319 RepID=UPI003F612CB9